MAGTKISALPIGTTPAGTEKLAAVQSGATVSLTVAQIAGLAGGVTHTAGALTASAVVVGNGTDDVKVLASLGTTTTVLHGNAAGLPTFAAVSLAADVSGSLPLANGGTSGTDAATARTALGAGDASTNTATSVDSEVALFSSTTGKILKRATGTGLAKLTSGVLSVVPQTQCIAIACSDETTALTTGTAKVTFRMPFPFTLTDVRASVTTAPTGGTLLTVDVNEAGTTILSTKLTFDASEKTTTPAATPRVISDTSLADDAEMTVDVDAVGSTIAGAGLKVYLIGWPT